MQDAAMLARALRSAIDLRDKGVVVQLDAAALADPVRLGALAADMAQGRALGLRVLAVCDPGTGAGPLEVQGPALRLIAALDRHGARGVLLSAAHLVTAYPGMPVVHALVLVQLCSLAYVPVLVLPAVDAAGAAANLSAQAVAAAAARFTEAAMVVVTGEVETPAPGAVALPGPPIVATRAAAPGELLADILLHAPPPAPAAAAAPR